MPGRSASTGEAFGVRWDSCDVIYSLARRHAMPRRRTDGTPTGDGNEQSTRANQVLSSGGGPAFYFEDRMSKKPKTPDWRSLPRKPASQKRTARIAVKLTEADAERLRANAVAAELTITDLIRERCCG